MCTDLVEDGQLLIFCVDQFDHLLIGLFAIKVVSFARLAQEV
jgi:hypothetical protein